MQFVKYNTSNSKRRYLISGFSKTGKTTSLPTFIYGLYDPLISDQREDAFTYAADKRMVILACPGESGLLSLPDTDLYPHITSYQLEVDDTTKLNDLKWSIDALKAFHDISEEVRASKPDIICIDGIHALYEQMHNKTTEGRYLNGELGKGNKPDTFLFGVTHAVFGNYIAHWYNSNIPLVVMTTWEQWETSTSESDKPLTLHELSQAVRYRIPALPGAMANAIVGRFDARLSAGLTTVCIHNKCSYTANRTPHYTWQIYPKGDVKNIGINGLRVNQAIINNPYIHQNYHALQQIIIACGGKGQ